MTDRSMIRLGWLVQYRLHGVRLDGQNVAGARCKTSFQDSGNFYVEIAEKPSVRVYRQKPPLNVRRKGDAINVNLDTGWPDPNEDGYRAPFVWLTAIADALFPIPGEVMAPRGDEQHHIMSTIRPYIPASRWDMLLSDARSVAAVAAADYQGIIIQRWGEAEVAYLDSSTHGLSPFVSVEIQLLEDTVLDGTALPKRLAGHLKDLAEVRLRHLRTAQRLSVAGQSLIRARQERFDSPERFLGTFRAMEVLATIDQSDPGAMSQFDAIRELIPAEKPELRQFLEGLRAAHRPPLATRFAHLARTYSPESAAADIEVFRRAAKRRTNVMHGKVSGATWDEAETLMQAEFEKVVNRYLRLLLAKKAVS